MAERQDIETRMVVEGQPYLVRLINNPTIEDVVVTEMRLSLAEKDGSVVLDDAHRVSKDIRDFLIRLGVER